MKGWCTKCQAWRSPLSIRWVAAWAWLLSMPCLMAHGDLHGQIQELSAEILQKPGQGELYFKRAELHRAHGSLDAADADYDQAGRLAPELSGLDFGRGQVFLAAGKLVEALEAFDRFLLAHPRHVPGYVARAKTRSMAKAHLAAAADYTLAIQSCSQPEPEYYLARAQALADAGPEHVVKGLEGINEGLTRLGEVLTLELHAVDLELSLKRYEGALQRIERIRKKGGRQEFWLERRGDILNQAGRSAEAQLSYKAALEAAQSRPPRLRATDATRKIEERLRQKYKLPDSASVGQ